MKLGLLCYHRTKSIDLERFLMYKQLTLMIYQEGKQKPEHPFRTLVKEIQRKIFKNTEYV